MMSADCAAPRYHRAEDADQSSDLGFIKTGTTSINPDDRQFYLHPHPQSLHHTTAATAVSTHLKTLSLISAGASRQSELSVCNILTRQRRGSTWPYQHRSRRQRQLHAARYCQLRFCTGNEIISIYLPQFIPVLLYLI